MGETQAPPLGPPPTRRTGAPLWRRLGRAAGGRGRGPGTRSLSPAAGPRLPRARLGAGGPSWGAGQPGGVPWGRGDPRQRGDPAPHGRLGGVRGLRACPASPRCRVRPFPRRVGPSPWGAGRQDAGSAGCPWAGSGERVRAAPPPPFPGRGRRSREAAGPWAEDVRQPGAAPGLGTAPPRRTPGRGGRGRGAAGRGKGGAKGGLGRTPAWGTVPVGGGGCGGAGCPPPAPGTCPGPATAPPGRSVRGRLDPRQAPGRASRGINSAEPRRAGDGVGAVTFPRGLGCCGGGGASASTPHPRNLLSPHPVSLFWGPALRRGGVHSEAYRWQPVSAGDRRAETRSASPPQGALAARHRGGVGCGEGGKPGERRGNGDSGARQHRRAVPGCYRNRDAAIRASPRCRPRDPAWGGR